MNEHVELAIDAMADAEAVCLGYLNPDPFNPTGSGGGTLKIAYESKHGRVKSVGLSAGASIARSELEMLFRAACRHCSTVYVDDLHELLLAIRRPGVKVPDPRRDGEALVFDLSFGKYWTGSDDETKPWDLVTKLGDRDVVSGCHELLGSTSKRARWYYFNHYIDIVSTYASIETEPVVVWDEENGKRVKRWVQYDFNGTKTGRLCMKGSASLEGRCLNPHLMPKKLRPSIFRAASGRQIVYIDYNAAEVSIAACLSKDEAMIKVLRSGLDPYVEIGKACGDIDRASVKQALISGFLYGASVSRISEDTGLESDEIRRIIGHCENTYRRIGEWVRRLVDVARTEGVVRTPMGRSIQAQKDRARVLGPNYMSQSTNADLNTATYAHLVRTCREERSWIKPMVHIHDGYVFDVPLATAEEDEEFLVEQAGRPVVRVKELDGLVVKVSSERSDCWK
jgi:hypothetical protein